MKTFKSWLEANNTKVTIFARKNKIPQPSCRRAFYEEKIGSELAYKISVGTNFEVSVLNLLYPKKTAHELYLISGITDRIKHAYDLIYNSSEKISTK